MQQCECRRERTVELLTGNSVCSYCPHYKAECFARWEAAQFVLSLKSIESRQAELADYERRNGPAAAERLRNIVRKMWGER